MTRRGRHRIARLTAWLGTALFLAQFLQHGITAALVFPAIAVAASLYYLHAKGNR